MINAIAELGKYEKANNPDIKSNFDIWLEDSFDATKYPHLLLIEFTQEKNEEKSDLFDEDWKWIFKRVDYQEHSSQLKSKLLYKRGSSRGTDKTPTCKTTNNIIGSYNLKIKSWFKQNQNVSFIDQKGNDLIKMISTELEAKSDEINLELINKSENISNGGAVLSVVFDDNGKRNFIGDYDFFTKFITEESKANYFRKYKKESNSKNKECSICKQKKEEIFGFFSSLAFYTVDKPGMVTGGFDQSKSWKNYPICLECALDVELGIKMMENNFIFNFYGLRYYLIPKTISENAKDEIIDTILEYKKSQRINDSDRITITNAENEIFDILQEQKNNVTFNLLFFEKPQKSVFRILASIEDVLPSRIKQLFATKDFVDNLFIFRNEQSNAGNSLYKFNFGTLNNVFPFRLKQQKLVGKHKDFLQCVESIFNDSKIDYIFLIQNTMDFIRKLFIHYENKIETDDSFFFYNSFWKKFEVNQSHIKAITLTNFMLINFLNKLNLFRLKNKEDVMDSQFYESFELKSKDELEAKTELFFDNFKEFFGSDVQRSIFLMGVLTQFLLNIQKQPDIRGATPFRSKLKGLKMDARDVSTLLPEIIDKLEQYGKNFYVPLENVISKYLISAGNFKEWNLSVDEMNFVFVLGMNLSKYFKIKTEEKNEEE